MNEVWCFTEPRYYLISTYACNCRVQAASKRALLIYLFLTQDNPLSEEKKKKDSWRTNAPDPDDNKLNFTFWRPAKICFQSLPKRVSYTLGLWPPIKLRAKRGPLVTGHQSCGSKSANTPENRKLPSQSELGTTFPHSFHFSSTVM